MVDKTRIENAVREILLAIGENPEREGLLDTPARVARMYEEIFSGVSENMTGDLRIFSEPGSDEMVLIKDIPVYSMCEHHLIPFFGKAHIAYIPKEGRILGLSKFARIVDAYAKKPQLQERLTAEIADCIMKTVKPMGVAVVLEAEHLCMTMRGVRKAGAVTQTSALRGIFRSDPRTRNEFMTLIR